MCECVYFADDQRYAIVLVRGYLRNVQLEYYNKHILNAILCLEGKYRKLVCSLNFPLSRESVEFYIYCC